MGSRLFSRPLGRRRSRSLKYTLFLRSLVHLITDRFESRKRTWEYASGRGMRTKSNTIETPDTRFGRPCGWSQVKNAQMAPPTRSLFRYEQDFLVPLFLSRFLSFWSLAHVDHDILYIYFQTITFTRTQVALLRAAIRRVSVFSGCAAR